MTRKQKHLLTRILVAAVLFLAGSLLHLPNMWRWEYSLSAMQ